jgi:VWFA-related protein
LYGATASSPQNSKPSSQPTSGQIQIPNRANAPLFKGKQGKQKTEIRYDPATHTVTLKLLVQDPNGYFIPNIRRENFVVYENGVRQQNASVNFEHAPASIGLLLEFGGRMPGLNRELGHEVSRAGQHLVEELAQDDKLAMWRYSDKVEKLSGFSDDKTAAETLLVTLGTPEISEANLYDAIVYTLGQMKAIAGRKAIVLISSGIDTFSKATYQDTLNSAQNFDTPIYVLSLATVLQQFTQFHDQTGPIARIDWKKAESGLEEIARVSGGRAYAPEDTVDLSPYYDDMMENLKVRYVITYRSSTNLSPDTPRTVRVELVDPSTGGPLQIVDSNGRTIRYNVILEDRYVPSAFTKH